jgi:hypothetical protein
MSTTFESLENKQGKIADLVDKFKTLSITPEEALEIMTSLKVAIQSGDETYVGKICSRLNKDKDDFIDEPSKNCEDLLSMENTCSSIIINYNTPENDESNPDEYIKILNDSISSCGHAYIYVDSSFEAFLDKDIDYLAGKKIETVDIIVNPEGKNIYSGPLNSKIEPVVNKEKREGWFILIGVMIFIALGILLRNKMR